MSVGKYLARCVPCAMGLPRRSVQPSQFFQVGIVMLETNILPLRLYRPGGFSIICRGSMNHNQECRCYRMASDDDDDDDDDNNDDGMRNPSLP